MKALLLAGGHGTRLRPLTFTGNKHMLPIANKPMILYSLSYLIEAGIREIGVVLGPINEDVKSLLGDGSKFDVKITYIEQPEPKGLAHAVMISEDFLNEPFVMCLGDNLLSQGAKPFVEQFQKNNPNCVLALHVSEIQVGMATHLSMKPVTRRNWLKNQKIRRAI